MVKKREVLFQLVFHALVLTFFVYNWYAQEFRPDRIWFFIMYALASFFVSYYMMPKFFYTKKYYVFAGLLVVLIGILIGLEELVLEPALFPDSSRAKRFPGILPSLAGVLPVMAVLTGGKFAWDSFQKQLEIDDLQSVIQESELQFLRSQVNPHFLFNNLNNLYSYALEGSTKTPEIILELSGVLRYMLYECKEELVPLDKELEQLGNFIRLYKLQIEERGNVDFHTKAIGRGYKIAPLILIVFIENAFKHSQSGQSSDIEISINLEMEGNTLKFQCRNNFEKNEGLDTVAKGIGLANVRKRLALLYPKKHKLDINEETGSYEVNLSLELQKA
ncbi:sensor histidine kinase [Croceivirga thetidis]|uniref:Histidine kinase n=1 Tax=Croceivirga thetidis TaxID=2721623 RepID=A0ABX1GTR8_9FLAO|nr:histidine kinase [Croceivirga thetidis]NKI33350.1 histidine kinase [Croceivirga thetidis]